MRSPPKGSSVSLLGACCAHALLSAHRRRRAAPHVRRGAAQVERARAAAAFAQGEAAAEAARRADEADAGAAAAGAAAGAWRERAEAAEHELGEVKARAWALLEQKDDELRAARVRAPPRLPGSGESCS